jgi:hypothetical protein
MLQRHPRRRSQNFLQRSPKAFDDRNAASLADRAKTLTDVVTLAPGRKVLAAELLALVRDQVARSGTNLAHYLSDKTTYLLRAWRLTKAPRAKNTARVVIEDHSQPPTERPALRQGAGQPRGPEPRGGRHGRDIGVPQVVGVLGGDPSD